MSRKVLDEPKKARVYSSPEPLRYGSAHFEDRLGTVWRDAFDDHVSGLRRLEVRVP
jgi:hypothetical protein